MSVTDHLQAVQQFGSGHVTSSGSGFTDDSDSDNRHSHSMFGSPGIWARIHTIYYRYKYDIHICALGNLFLLKHFCVYRSIFM